MKTTTTNKKASLTTNLFKFFVVGALLFAACIDSALAASTINRSLPPTYTPGSIVPVTINVTPNPASYLYGVEEVPPAGWTISNISHGGIHYTNSSGSKIIKWGFFAGTGIFDNSSTPILTPVPRSLTYSATPPPGASGSKTFVGTLKDGISSIPIPNSTMNLQVADITPPVITVLPRASNINNKGATILWTTNEVSDSKVEYGLAPLDSQVTNSSLVTSHGMTLSSLSNNRAYYYRVISKDRAGNAVVSLTYTFDTAEPVAVSGSISASSLDYSQTSEQQGGFDSFQNILSPQSGEMTIKYSAGSGDAVSSLAAEEASTETGGISGEVTITVYDRKGNTVKRLVRAGATRGSHSVTWDGKNEQGSPVATGVYFVVMQRGNKSYEKKVVVLK